MSDSTTTDIEDSGPEAAIVTGASSGIGEATATALAEAGVSVALAARSEDDLHAVADRIQSAGGDAIVLPTDVTDEEDVDALVDRTLDAFGRIDVLVNSAGMMVLDELADADRGAFDDMLEVNLLALIDVTRAVLPAMQAQGSGHVVNISSLAGRKSFPGASGYSASKYGVDGFSEALREEFTGEGTDAIRVTDVEPGFVETELSEGLPPEWMETLTPDDVARAVRYAVRQPPHVDVNEILLRPTEMQL